MTRRCTHCCQWKDLAGFYPRRDRPGRYYTICRQCTQDRAREREANQPPAQRRQSPGQINMIDGWERPKWQLQANCTGAEPDVFFPPIGNKFSAQYSEARRLCAACPVRGECLEWALSHERYGFWGGTTPRERQAIRRHNRSA